MDVTTCYKRKLCTPYYTVVYVQHVAAMLTLFRPGQDWLWGLLSEYTGQI